MSCEQVAISFLRCHFYLSKPHATCLQMAGLGYSLDFTTRGVRLSFGGFGDKMPDFIDKVAEAVASYNPTDPVEFERLRDVVSFLGFSTACLRLCLFPGSSRPDVRRAETLPKLDNIDIQIEPVRIFTTIICKDLIIVPCRPGLGKRPR